MDALRNTFAIDIERVITYELGRCIAGRPQPPSDGPPPEFYTSLAFREEMDLVKSNVNAMAARMQRIEQAVASQTVASPRASSSGARKRSSQGLNTDIYRDGAQRPFDR
ncbi:hypothetical protein IWQ56_002820 [Coemansia nantahalensis]|nr:hypothetical protein IWQ56_002820 [Coemansia nantahalensis]